MKRIVSILLVIMLLCVPALSASAAPAAPEITMQPQNPNYTNYGVAIYTVKVSGTNLSATWYMTWQGTTYTISDYTNGFEPWEAYAGELYGAKKLDANTFAFIFEGIEKELDGAYIWCVIEDGHYSVESQKARVSVGNPNLPPEILDVPAKLTVQQDAEAEIRCIAKSPDGSQLSFLWYETATGKLEDIIALNRGTEDCDYLFCDTSKTGTRNYVCMIQTSNGGVAYTSVIPVTVTAAPATAEPTIQTKTLPNATAGESYSVQLKCTDPNASFVVHYNPGKANDFSKTGLTLSSGGKITGTPQNPGTYEFCICAAGAGGEDYMVYTLVVKKAQPTTEPVTEPVTEPETTPITEPEITETIPETIAQTEPTKPEVDAPVSGSPSSQTSKSEGLPPWVLIVVGILFAGAGVVVAFALTSKKK